MTEKELKDAIQKAKETLKKNKVKEPFGLCVSANNIDVILSALEKQIPKKPIGLGGCPVCYQIMSTSPNYCPHCGQKLDWSEGNE